MKASTKPTTSKTRALEKLLMSEMILAIMGVDRFAYVRTVNEGSRSAFAVHAADGTRLAIFDRQEDALYSIHRHNLTPVNVH